MTKKQVFENQVIIYEGREGQPRIEVNLKDETVWLSQSQMAELFGRDQSVISRHI